MRDGSQAYWHKNLQVLAILLSIWFTVSYLLGIVFVEDLNKFRLGGFPLGFWFAQQGSIYVFILLILVYAIWMDRIDAAVRPPVATAPDTTEPHAAGTRKGTDTETEANGR